MSMYDCIHEGLRTVSSQFIKHDYGNKAVFIANIILLSIYATSRILILTRVNGKVDRLCGLVVRVPGYRSRGPEFDSGRYQIF
jgi:hypothetical protein